MCPQLCVASFWEALRGFVWFIVVDEQLFHKLLFLQMVHIRSETSLCSLEVQLVVKSSRSDVSFQQNRGTGGEPECRAHGVER